MSSVAKRKKFEDRGFVVVKNAIPLSIVQQLRESIFKNIKNCSDELDISQEDIHNRTKKFAKALKDFDWLDFNLSEVETNILIVKTNHPKMTAFDIAQYLKEKDIRVLSIDHEKIRMILHLDIRDEHITELINTFREIL